MNDDNRVRRRDVLKNVGTAGTIRHSADVVGPSPPTGDGLSVQNPKLIELTLGVS